jgi:hypothetical protein
LDLGTALLAWFNGFIFDFHLSLSYIFLRISTIFMVRGIFKKFPHFLFNKSTLLMIKKTKYVIFLHNHPASQHIFPMPSKQKVFGNRSVRAGIATGYGLDDRGVGVRLPSGTKILVSAASGLQLGPTQLPIQWVSVAISPGVKQRGREADHSPPTSAEVKKTWICISTPQYAFMA